MANILKQTLYWVNPIVFTLSDFAGTGVTETRAITAAEAHDGDNATYEGASVSSDGHGNDGAAQLRFTGPMTTAGVTGSIAFIRLVARARVVGAGSGPGAQLAPLVGGTAFHGNFILGPTFGDIIDTYLGFPPALTVWSNALLNATSFGVLIDFGAVDTDYPLACQPQLSEFSVEVWGPDTEVLPADEVIEMVQVIDGARVTATIGIPKAV